MTIKELCKLSHDMAVEKGFWDNTKIIPKRFLIEEKILLIITELAEAVEALRKGRKQEFPEVRLKGHINKKDRNIIKKATSKLWLKDTFEDEIADVFIRLGDMCEALGIDIEWQIKQKMSYNKTRPKKHGKEF